MFVRLSTKIKRSQKLLMILGWKTGAHREFNHNNQSLIKGNNKITKLRTILQRESQNS